MAAINQLFIYDCLTQKLRVSDNPIMTIGANRKNTFVLDIEAEEGGTFVQRNDNCHFFPHGSIISYALNGTQQQNDVLIVPGKFYLFILGRGCFICWFGPHDRMPDFASFDPSSWYLYNQGEKTWVGPIPLTGMVHVASILPETALATFAGLDRQAFLLRDILPVAQRMDIRNKVEQTATNGSNTSLNEHPNEEESLCPFCWKTFPSSKIKSIAVHANLIGDTLLGGTAMRRFLPSVFNEKGQPVDDEGMVCTEFACPHCHHQLPTGFCGMQQDIFSLVGAPSSGKTYYLTTLIRTLEKELVRDFHLSFRDSDPTTNTSLNTLKNSLFSAHTPAEAYLPPTSADGDLYETVSRNGHRVRLPKPFIYNLQKGTSLSSLIFYDNDGECYKPGNRGENATGAQHMTVASAVFFLFDPIGSPIFRRLLQGTVDPQYYSAAEVLDQQDGILTETEVRIKTARFLQPQEKLDIPFAFIIGKSDLWQHLLGPEPLLPIVREGYLMPEMIDANSQRLRDFMFGIHPDLCSNAESISNHVRYFAVSSLGESPVEFIDPNSNQKLIAPNPALLNPQRVSDPLLWSLHVLHPDFFPTPAV